MKLLLIFWLFKDILHYFLIQLSICYAVCSHFVPLVSKSCLAAVTFSSISISSLPICSSDITNPTKLVVTHFSLPGSPYLDSISNFSSWPAGSTVLILSLILETGTYAFMVLHNRSHIMV